MKIKTAIVTGGVKRLGKAIADYLASRGWKVIRTSHESNPIADIVCDLREENAPFELLEKAKSLLGGEMPFALVNNAAIYMGDCEDIMKVDFLAPKKLIELFSIPDGRIRSAINILDAAILGEELRRKALARAHFEKYAAAKIALADYTIEAAAKFASSLRVNAIAPGAVLAPESLREKAPPLPLGRPTPLAIAQAAEFLLEAKFTTGLVIPVDSGARFAPRI